MWKGWRGTSLVAGALASISLWGCGADEGDGSQDGASARDLGLIQKDTLTVGSEIPFPPFEAGEPPDYEGFDIDVINGIADNLGLETEIEDIPLSSILRGGSGSFDVAISAVEITPARERRVNFSHPYFIGALSLVVPDDSEIRARSDLREGMTLGAEDGTTGEKYAEADTGASEVRAFASATEAFDALLHAEIEAVVASPEAAEEAVETEDGLTIADTFPTGERYGIVVPEGMDDLLEAVNSALTELKEEGALTGLYEDYFGIEAPAQVARPQDAP
ncbi:MAG: ABC transporter substrate-binding protein [Actinomycetota bacterium]|nr:ABC transporter substrate-binding protein [Actinomycetota bacterium]